MRVVLALALAAGLLVAFALRPQARPAGMRLLKDAPQYHYRQGVPHTDRHGRRLLKYDPKSSFFPIFIYQSGDPAWMRAGIKQPKFGHGFDYLKAAHFNTAFLWKTPPRQAAPEARRYGLQMIAEHFRDEDVGNFPEMLAWIPYEEIGHFVNDGSIAEKYDDYRRRREVIRAANPQNVVTIIDNIWTGPPLWRYFLPFSWSRKWSLDDTDVFAFDYYHFMADQPPDWLRSEYRSLVNVWASLRRHFGESKPIWPMLGAADWNGDPTYGTRYPPAAQLRCEAFLSVILGATGLSYFDFDWYGGRAASVLGVRPDVPESYDRKLMPWYTDPAPLRAAPPALRRQGQELWAAIAAINKEIGGLIPVLLQPTSPLDYEVYTDNQGFYATPVYTLLKHYRGRDYLWLVNVDAVHPARVQVKFPDGGLVEGQLNPYEARVVSRAPGGRARL